MVFESKRIRWRRRLGVAQDPAWWGIVTRGNSGEHNGSVVEADDGTLRLHRQQHRPRQPYLAPQRQQQQHQQEFQREQRQPPSQQRCCRACETIDDPALPHLEPVEPQSRRPAKRYKRPRPAFRCRTGLLATNRLVDLGR